MDVLSLVGRTQPLFVSDIASHEAILKSRVEQGRFLVIGGAGTIGQAVSREIFKRNPKALHVVDINENNMVELVRDIRSTLGYIQGEFATFVLDVGERSFQTFLEREQQYDYVLNLSALKHVRSEKDPFTLMRMLDVNVLNTAQLLQHPVVQNARKYFSVSTDKAADPVNMMGASKRIMEMFMLGVSPTLPVSMARFANVAFSDGSLLHGFNQRFLKHQPISAPHDVRRYFITPEESGQLCLLSCLLGENRDNFFPKLTDELKLTRFSDIAERYLISLGYEPVHCQSEDEARERAGELISDKKWPCYFFASDTTGEKDFEVFYTDEEDVDDNRFADIGVIRNSPMVNLEALNQFIRDVESIKAGSTWTKADIVDAFDRVLPSFAHQEKGKYLDGRM
ncbi:nucleoside-diphosphate sugar epimerase [Oleiphilus messinensis]|uniref:Nucleoside-diphosphate sugar epimerase n=1 Tax=Oleiphilus messinensis TaxID=141451 RepID=A0A1Y0IJ95_9GAMM|nr:UDP-N-acetylglucosamine 4,6-dehydratase [Oleiphilus messinensis]ARU59503.1 nucleoside-diphosphate sugar epimerase [Oleiphilus messinensis]